MLLRARQFEFRFPRPAIVMGIVNVTPDSFSDGGRYFNAEAAVVHALKLAEEGAEILDIGGESTRPGAKPVPEPEELRRVIPVIEQLAVEIHSRWGERPREPRSENSHLSTKTARGDARPTRQVLISIDTMKPAVARAALEAGASMVNDVAAARRGRFVRSSAFRRPSRPAKPHRLKAALRMDEMWEIVSEFRAGYICMHAQGTPRTMQRHPHYADVVREVREFFVERLEQLAAAGIAPEQVALDPGIGFGKTAGHNLELLVGLARFTTLRRPLLVGVSRKSFLGKDSGAAANERLPASLACAILAVESGARLIRAHDVWETVRAVRMAEAVLAERDA